MHPHFTEIDRLSKGKDSNLIAYVQPAKALKYNTHYAVVVQRLTDGNGNLLSSSYVMKDYKDAYFTTATYTSESIADVDRYYRFKRTVFPALRSSTLNVSLSHVQLVWDFHTASQSSLLRPLQDVYTSTLLSVSQKLGLSQKALQAELNHQAFTTQRNQFNGHNGPRGQANEIYRRVSHARPTCKGATSVSMASRVYYRISVPWYLKTTRVRLSYSQSNIVIYCYDKCRKLIID